MLKWELTTMSMKKMRRLKYICSPYYSSRPDLWFQNLYALDARSFISFEWQYVYLRIPKAANSTIVRTLTSHFPEPLLEAENVHEIKRRAKHYSDLNSRNKKMIEEFYTFTVVRNPFSRILSAYLDKFGGGNKLSQFGEAVSRYGEEGNISFNAFCRYLADGGERQNAHWMKQSRILNIASKIDFVGRFEDLEGAQAKILAGVRTRTDADRQDLRDGPAATGASEKLLHYYDNECIDIVSYVYREDFIRYKYSKSLL
ncbi:MAG: hypothetical protein CMK05_15640 [Ponticaulis sp.]|nr:hypothetical protein [Ponticaulis sp.]|tara:strand:+ start:25441 stop:26211 length:771 start_codon:yes stop_codon:yes gene_type:complete